MSGIALEIIMVAPIDQLRIHLDEAKIWSEGDNKLSIYGLLHALRGAAAVNGIRACKFLIARPPFVSRSAR